MNTTPGARAAASLKTLLIEAQASSLCTTEVINTAHSILDEFEHGKVPKRVARAGSRVLEFAAARLTRALVPEADEVRFVVQRDSDDATPHASIFLKDGASYIYLTSQEPEEIEQASLLEPMLRRVLLHPALYEFWLTHESFNHGSEPIIFIADLLGTDDAHRRYTDHYEDRDHLIAIAASIANLTPITNP